MFELVKDQLAAFNRPYEEAARRMPALVTGIDGNGGDIATVGADLEIAKSLDCGWPAFDPAADVKRVAGDPKEEKTREPAYGAAAAPLRRGPNRRDGANDGALPATAHYSCTTLKKDFCKKLRATCQKTKLSCWIR